MAQVEKLVDQIDEQVREYLRDLEITGLVKEAVYESIRAQCVTLARTDVREADGIRAFIASVSGHTEHYRAAIQNLMANRNERRATLEEFRHQINHGYALRAFEMIDAVIAARHDSGVMNVSSAMFSTGGFQAVNELVLGARARQEQVVITPLFLKVQEVVSVMTQLNVQDRDIARMMDVAGRFLREKGLLWAGDTPHVSTLAAGQGGPQILVEYFVGVTPSVAADMSWRLTESLIDEELDVQGVALNFVGINA